MQEPIARKLDLLLLVLKFLLHLPGEVAQAAPQQQTYHLSLFVSNVEGFTFLYIVKSQSLYMQQRPLARDSTLHDQTLK